MYIYNVTINIDESVEKDWLRWMQEKQQSAESHDKGVWKALIVAVTLVSAVVCARERCENISHATL